MILSKFQVTNLIISEWQALFLIGTIFVYCRLREKSFMANLLEYLYGLISNIAKSNVSHHPEHHVKFLFYVFLFIFFTNLFGLIPHVFCFNAHIIVTFTWAMIVFSYAVYSSMRISPKKFFKNFTPSGVNLAFLILLVPIKVLSFCIKPVSLAMRLFLNVMAGHIMLGLCEHFIMKSYVFGIFPFLATIVLTTMEFIVCLLQAYFFVISSSVLINDALPH